MIQIATLKDFQDAITSYCQQVLADRYPMPPIITWAYEGAPRPTVFPYLSINAIGRANVGQAWQSPAIPVRDGEGNVTGYGQLVRWDEDPTVSFQVHGLGASDVLDAIHDTLDAPWWHDVLEGLGLVARDHSDPRDVSIILDGLSPELRWVMDITFGLPAELDQPNAPWIEFVQLTENYAMPDSTPAVPDVLTTGPVTVGQ